MASSQSSDFDQVQPAKMGSQNVSKSPKEDVRTPFPGDRGLISDDDREDLILNALERELVRKVDWRLCSIAGILCSLNLLDSGIIVSSYLFIPLKLRMLIRR